MKKRIIPVNKNATKEVCNVLEYLASISGSDIIAGQHTQTMDQKELLYIERLTGKLPALCGFELLAYSPNINYDESDEVCLKEVEENKNTLDAALKWANDHRGLITFTWHWFSPVGGKGKAFYSRHTDFDPRDVLVENSKSRSAFYSDMDHMAQILMPFKEAGMPIIWRPLHESEGTWFWWGSKGPAVAAELYKLMFDHFTGVHALDNLIWVWNCPLREGYVGDEYADIISVDIYPEKHSHLDFETNYNDLMMLCGDNKIAALAEIGVLPDVKKIAHKGIPWSWFMTWSNEFCIGESYSRADVMRDVYCADHTVTLDKLPALY